jgi:hypothetical protein
MESILTTDEWASLIISTPLSLKPLVLRLALRHGYVHAEAGPEGGCLRLRPNVPAEPDGTERHE